MCKFQTQLGIDILTIQVKSLELMPGLVDGFQQIET